MLAPLSADAKAATFLDEGPLTSDAGHFLIEWRADGPVTLEMAAPGAPTRTLYSGENRALFISGLENGSFTLSLKDQAGAQADTLEITAAHQSLTQALWLAALGALAFVATVIVILRGARG